jgi:hypothetical protein
MQTFSLPFRFEGVGLNGVAIVMTQPVLASVNFVGWRVSYAMGFSKSSPTGFAECLFEGDLCTGTPTFDNSTKLMWPNGPVQLTSDFGPATIANPNKVPSVGPGATNYTGNFFTTIMKANSPNSQSLIESISGLSIPAAAGDYLMFYMAQENEANIPADCEIQGTLFYTLGN